MLLILILFSAFSVFYVFGSNSNTHEEEVYQANTNETKIVQIKKMKLIIQLLFLVNVT